MIPFERLQLIGPAALVIAAMAAEASAHALAYSPSSEVLWYFNLNCFPMFQKSYYFFDYYVGYGSFQLFVVGFPLFLISYALIGKHLLPFAIATNLSLLYVGFLIFTCLGGGASKINLSFAGACVFILLIIATLPSMIASHFAFILAIRNRA